ncbi:DEAD/DEAH box helicase [Bacillus canaveralius]|uniref:DEAD/DEAH box helicase n=1 Tax=Bacillus canaveralius TaxID=1403243 RepID=A0A2N5GPL0_9BACI|nr:DEAD/DEAH box helicase [Bacillus canaveralius]PLR84647.1 DEAD/DEAH box helicase [Bacillus canaveralius]PLS00799.1 DEAD/DEAH box helicase [Bacillus canaveralius]
MKFKPHLYQDFAIRRIIEQPAVGLFLDMGMGKTVSTLTAVADLLHDYFEVSKVLVIAPLRVAEDTWSRETEKWDHTRYMKVSKVLGPESKRIQAVMTPADLYVINRENVEWLVGYYKSKWPFDMVVIDELSSFKSSKAKRFRALKKVRPFIKRLVGLTGTPAPNSLIDLWPQLYLLDGGERLGKTITGYRDRYFQPDQRNRHIVYSWRLRPEAEKAIHSKISDICISMQAKDWLDLPERIDNPVRIPLPAPVRQKYKQMERDLLLPFTDGDVVADTAAVLSNKLLQLANGAVYDENKAVQEIHQEKLKKLEDIIDAANGKPILVFYTYQHDLARIQKHFKQAKLLENSQDIADWNKSEIPMLLAHPASAGHGLNLQAGGHIIVWFGLTWSLELYQQANARLDRQGQEHRVIVHHLVAEGTVDEDVMKVLEGKAIGQDALLAAVKARIEKINT